MFLQLPCSLSSLPRLPGPTACHLPKGDPHLPGHGGHPGEGDQEGVLHEKREDFTEAGVVEQERPGEQDDEEPLVAEEQGGHHRHLHPTKNLLAQLRNKEVQDKSDKKKKLRDQKKSCDNIA